MTLSQYKMKTPVGDLFLVASEKGLKSVQLSQDSNLKLLRSLDTTSQNALVLKEAIQQLQEYFEGQRTKFNLNFDIEGTSFQKSVWKELSRIPFGAVCSYQDIAKKIRNPNAVRAVGSANGKNPLCIIVPCHRVITSDNRLGGYSGGLEVKLKLLKLENSLRFIRNL